MVWTQRLCKVCSFDLIDPEGLELFFQGIVIIDFVPLDVLTSARALQKQVSHFWISPDEESYIVDLSLHEDPTVFKSVVLGYYATSDGFLAGSRFSPPWITSSTFPPSLLYGCIDLYFGLHNLIVFIIGWLFVAKATLAQVSLLHLRFWL